jgi:hypothetical protein
MRVSSLLYLSLSGLVVSSPLGSHVLHEKRDAAPVAWTKYSRAPKDTVLPVRIGLTQRNLEHSDRFLDDISDPDSPNFGMNSSTPLLFRRLTEFNRKALECRARCEHICTAPRCFENDSRLAAELGR